MFQERGEELKRELAAGTEILSINHFSKLRKRGGHILTQKRASFRGDVFQRTSYGRGDKALNNNSAEVMKILRMKGSRNMSHKSPWKELKCVGMT